MGSYYVTGRVCLGRQENFGDTEWWLHSVNVLNATELYNLKWLKCQILYIFYHNKNFNGIISLWIRIKIFNLKFTDCQIWREAHLKIETRGPQICDLLCLYSSNKSLHIQAWMPISLRASHNHSQNHNWIFLPTWKITFSWLCFEFWKNS